MDYPTEEEEFELMYEDELELLREQEEVDDAPKAKKALNFNQLNSQPVNNPPKANFQSNTQILGDTQNSQNITSKRSIQELFGDIDDILSENIVKKKRKNDEKHDDLALIEHIVQLRKANRDKIVPTNFLRNENSIPINYNLNNISLSVPKYSFIALMNQEGQRVYIRCHSEMFEKEERDRIAQQSNFRGVMGSTFNEIWKEAQEYINKQFESTSTQETPNPEEMLQIENDKDLWVEIYKPKKYYELLSDESTNRTLLKWLKLWDKAVFHRNPKIKQPAPNLKNKSFQKFQKQELVLELEPDGRPKYKVALLCGPPGLGKTTLAHMVAKHCGYNVVEINASDDRNLDSFKNALENATSMKSVLDLDKRPNCLVFDEIDGAPNNSIDYLIKFINGIETKKKGKKLGTKHVLRRPIICICNDVYVPSLRSLRQIAFIVNFPPTASSRLAERLNVISRYQGIKTDMGALLALAEKTENDIRACLSILHFFKVQNKPVTLSDVWKMSIGQKDMQKGLFAVWQDIFQIDKNQKNRSKKILSTVQSFGDYERLTQGIFENFPTLQIKDSSLLSTVEAEEWFCFNDLLNRRIQSQQDYSLSVYLPFGFVTWHLAFAGFARPKISYPNAWFEMRTKAQKREGLIKEVLKGMKPAVKMFVQSDILNLEIFPYLSQIIVPPLRPVNLHFCTEQEKEVLKNVVDIMIDYNLNYVQERTLEGNYVYNVDPNIEEVTVFSLSTRSRTLSYSNKQMIGQEIDVEKMRRIEGAKFKEDKKGLEKNKTEVPNHLQKLKVKNVKPKGPMVRKDFFGRIIKETPKGDAAATIRNDIYFQFKEGHTNAVKRPVKIKDFY